MKARRLFRNLGALDFALTVSHTCNVAWEHDHESKFVSIKNTQERGSMSKKVIVKVKNERIH